MEMLTKTEEKVMQILWELKRGFVKDVIDKMEEPQPPYNTVSSLIRILEKKGFVDHKAYGKTHEYFPAISKLAYRSFTFKNFVTNYFEGSPENVISYMVREENLGQQEIDKMKELLNQKGLNKTESDE
ncbi:BlaI/MecI/CopY family transcriptional regulator [Dyadobacter psychrotolerans]|uniref:BlaI/MecI/CopY family transcriptional regulator n=1 Tax=Dyadobacter psychrotolerans TaxID=2541721 RepID=A0A4V2Z488_9BACT|nr:BlaI/MecI/CopY family transcriptional regulator [Dyadobacter psychrotolerans]TDE15688.1 BlaI/MecI/CopY family transcriptional regulator [Dyadobacter psychrotolerans]